MKIWYICAVKKTDETSLQVAKLLLEIKAVKLSPDQPFKWASGWNSPIYCDNRITLSYPKIRTYIRQMLSETIRQQLGEVDIIAGVATAGIPQAALVAEEMGLPLIYVRSSAKEHGMGNQIEGVIRPDATVVVIEDLISTGGSSLKAVEAIQAAGMQVKAVLSTFTYEFPKANKAFKDAKIPLFSLSNYSALLQVAKEENYIQEADIEKLSSWREKPELWMKD